MTEKKKYLPIAAIAAVALVAAACSSSDDTGQGVDDGPAQHGGMDMDGDDATTPPHEEIATAKAKAVGLAATIDVAKATANADGTFDGAPLIWLLRLVMATNDGDMVTCHGHGSRYAEPEGRSGDFEMRRGRPRGD